MKITLLDVENFKRIKKITVSPGERNLLLVGGKNKQGKSSLLGAISAALGGLKEAPDKPVRLGEKSATIRLELDDGRIIVQRRFLDNGNTRLEVTTDDGKLKSPQAVLDKIVGTRFLDPLRFVRLNAKQQREVLLSLIDLDLDLDAHAQERKDVYDKRTVANREVKRLKAQLDGINPVSDIPDAVAVDDVMASLEHAQKTLSSLRRDREAYDRALRARDKLAQQLKDAEAALQAAGDALQSHGDADEDILADQVAKAKQTIASASETNETRAKLIAQKERFESARDQLANAVKQASALDQELKELDQEKEDALASAALPIDNLSITDDGLTYNGLPLSQASGAEQLQVSLAIAAALSPQLNDIWIEDGALLDHDHLELVASFAAQHDLRVWLERVGDNDDDMIIIEEGSIRP